MLADQVGSRLPHAVKIRLKIQHGAEFPVKYRLSVPETAGIGIKFPGRLVPRMEAFGSDLYLVHCDIVGQIMIQILPDRIRGERGIQMDVRNHGFRVNTGIRPSGTDDLGRGSAHLPQYRF